MKENITAPKAEGSAIKFYELAVGAQFSFRGGLYKKVAISMARDEQRVANIFQGQTDVTIVGEVLLLPPEEAARWKPKAWAITVPSVMAWPVVESSPDAAGSPGPCRECGRSALRLSRRLAMAES